jgi:pyruvate dehydrogenase E1 component alpha subunit
MTDDAALFRRMLRIRRFEEQLILLHGRGEVSGIYHVCVGQEATAVGVTANMETGDVLYTTHRNHGHLLARGAEPAQMLAEILGRAGGYCHGRAGSLHLAAPELGAPFTSAMVGGSVSQAVGAAIAVSRTRPGSLVVSFFGDGNFEEGALYEAFNIASVFRLPILFVCEDNGLEAQPSPDDNSVYLISGMRELTDVPKAFSIPAVNLDGSDLAGVRETTAELVRDIRAGGGPRFALAGTVRWPGARMIWPTLPDGPTRLEWLTGDDDPRHEELASWTRSSDPLRRTLAAGAVDAATARALDEEVGAEIESAVAWALDSPFPDPAEATA